METLWNLIFHVLLCLAFSNTKWPVAKSESSYGKNDGREDEVEDADGEDEGSCLPDPGFPVEEEGNHHHQI